MLFVLANTKHDARLRHTHALLLRVPENAQALSERCPAVPNERCQRLHRFNIMSIDVKAGFRNHGNMVEVSGKVTRESLDENMRGSE